MKFLLYLVYYIEGFMMAIVACSCIGLSLAVIVALAKSPARPKNLLLALMYAAGAFVCYLLFFAGLHLAGWIGDRTHYVGQGGIIVGAISQAFSALRSFHSFCVSPRFKHLVYTSSEYGTQPSNHAMQRTPTRRSLHTFHD